MLYTLRSTVYTLPLQEVINHCNWLTDFILSDPHIDCQQHVCTCLLVILASFEVPKLQNENK